MTSRKTLGWHIPRSERDDFKQFVEEKWGETDSYMRFEMESAMREFLDADGILAKAEALLRKYLQSQGLSSSTDAVPSDISHADTVKLGHNVNEDLKEEFTQMAKQRYDDSYGAVLARALNAYRGGGRHRRILENVKQLFGGTKGGTTDGSDESIGGTDGVPDLSSAGIGGTTGVVDERSVEEAGTNGGTTDGSDESIVVEPEVVMEIAEELGDEFPVSVLEQTIVDKAGNDAGIVPAYREAVADYKHVKKHPHNETYITEEKYENTTFWCDLTRELRATRLRRLLVKDALEKRNQRHSVTYSEVIELFKEEFGTGPSHDYAYTLMDDAGNGDGFISGQYRGQEQLRVDVRKVSDGVIEDVLERNDYLDVDQLTIDGLITSYSPPKAPQQEGVADD